MTSPVFPWENYGETWHLRRPDLGDDPDTLDIDTLIEMILAHLPVGEQDAYHRLLKDDEDLDLPLLEAMLDAVHDVVSPDIPRPAMRTLLAVFDEVRPLIHGQLIRAGQPRGSDALNTYDAACVALAYLDDDFRGVPGFSVNEKARPKLLADLKIGRRPETDLDALAALQAGMGMAPGQTSARPSRKPDSPPAD